MGGGTGWTMFVSAKLFQLCCSRIAYGMLSSEFSARIIIVPDVNVNISAHNDSHGLLRAAPVRISTTPGRLGPSFAFDLDCVRAFALSLVCLLAPALVIAETFFIPALSPYIARSLAVALLELLVAALHDTAQGRTCRRHASRDLL